MSIENFFYKEQIVNINQRRIEQMTMEKRKSKNISRIKIFYMRLKRRKIAIISLIFCMFIVLVAIFAPWIAPHDPYKSNLRERFSPPSSSYFFGTDDLGRCLFSRVIYGARLSLTIGFVATFSAVIIGTILGLIAGGLGGRFGDIIMRATDIMMAFPYLLLILVLIAALGPGLRNCIIALTIWAIPHFIRLVYGSAISIRHMDFVIAATLIGEPKASIIFRYILPNITSPIIVQSTLYISRVIMGAAALGFLGLGVPPPHPEWGTLLVNAREYMRSYPYLLVFPSITLAIVTLSFNILGDNLRDILDTRIQDVVK